MSEPKIFNEFKCDECGKIIYAHVCKEQWGWRLSNSKNALTFCTYSCLRHYEKRAEERKNKRIGEKEKKLRAAFAKGLLPAEAAKETCCTERYALYCFKKLNNEKARQEMLSAM